MSFENILRISDLPDHPSFFTFWQDDINPVSGQHKKRELNAPNLAMRMIHDRLLAWLRGRWVSLPNATGGRKHNSPLKNVRRHQGNRYFYLLDIENAYHNVSGRRLAGVLCNLDSRLAGQEEAVHQFLTGRFIETAEGGLITGGPACVELYNYYAGLVLDVKLQSLCQKYGLTFTRYVDDITISSKESIGKRKRHAIRDLIIAAGFPLNHRKAALQDLCQQRVVITGVGLQWPGKIFLPRHYLLRLRGLLHRAVHRGDIAPAKINGMMSVFWAVTSQYGMNATERKLAKQYERTMQALSI